MGIVKRNNPNDLTDEEIAFLRGANLDPEVKNYLARQHENLGVKTTSFRKVAAAANAEADALLGVIRLSDVRGAAVEVAEAQAKLEAQEAQMRALEAENSRLRGEATRLRAIPAAAVNSGAS